MATISFFEKLEARVAAIDSLLCIGLDPHLKELTVAEDATEEQKCDAAYTFCKTLIDATGELSYNHKLQPQTTTTNYNTL
jgi:hypothetical protein